MSRKPNGPKPTADPPAAAAVDPPPAASVPALANPAFAQNEALDGESARWAKVWVDEQLARSIRPPRYLTVDRLGPLVPLQGDFDQEGFQNRLSQALGSLSSAFTKDVVTKLASSPKGASDDEISARVNVGLAFITSQKPANELETTILLQYWLSNRAMIRHVTSAEAATAVDHLNTHGALAAKLGNLGVRQLEALAKLRGGGEQKVTVTHVHKHLHIENAGQSALEDLRPGGGGERQINDQSHGTPANLAFSPGSPVWSEDPAREPMPVARDEGQGEMPYPRRQVRCAEG